ncbi:MAG TPA: ribonuclease P protein component [Mycobacteriales bacterium]|nr:ribonuclease P protein component [Mycobacteriales bacterium]
MLPAAARLRHRADFAAAMRRGRRVTRGPLVLHSAPATVLPTDRSVLSGEPRVGFVISAKVGDAVRRNLLRRRLRHLIRDRLPALPAGSVLVVRALPGAGALDHAALAGLLDDGLRALGRP